jgi:hypothetical protein
MRSPAAALENRGTSVALSDAEAGMKIKVQYDAYNRQFMLMDRPGATLRDGDIYLVTEDVSFGDFDFDSELLSDEEAL